MKMYFGITTKILKIVFLIGAAAYIWNTSVIYSQNNVFNNEIWYSYREAFIQLGLKVESVTSRSILAGNRLSADPLLGAQRLLTKKTFHPKEIQFDFRLKTDSYIDFQFNREESTFSGIRFSRHPHHPSSTYQSLETGEFTSFQKIEHNKLGQGLHKVRILQEGNKLILILNGKAIHSLNSSFSESKLGFQTSTQGPSIYNPRIRLNDESKVNLPFTSWQNFWPLYPMNFGLISLTILLFSGIYSLLNRSSFLLLVQKLSLFILLSGGLWFIFDYYYYSKISHLWDHTEANFNTRNSSLNLEKIRYELFNEWYEFIGGKKITSEDLNKRGFDYRPSEQFFCQDGGCREKPQEFPKKSGGALRIAILGRSLSAGATLVKLDETYHLSFHRHLKALLKGKSRLETLNISRTNLEISDMGEVKEDIMAFKPDYVVFEFMILDYQYDEYEEFLKFLNQENISIIVLRHLINPESLPSKFFHRIKAFTDKGLDVGGPDPGEPEAQRYKEVLFMRELKSKYKIFYFNPYDLFYRIENNDRGMIWWDGLHLTAFGHKLLGIWLADEMDRMMTEDQLKTGPPDSN